MTKQNTNDYIRPTLKQSIKSVLCPIQKSIKRIDRETRILLNNKNIENNLIEIKNRKTKRTICIYH